MRTLLCTVALLTLALDAAACDVCGCSIGGNYFGILPQFNRHFVGLRLSEQSFQSAHSRTAALAGRYDSDERFRTVDVWGRFYPARRLQVMAMAPYHDFFRDENGKQTHSQGFGDASVLANYVALNTGDSLGRGWKHTLTLGGGVKLPTGQHRLRDTEGDLLHENLQPGSGSTDFLVTAVYMLRKGAWGFSSDWVGRINTPNRNDYHFGNRLSGSLRAFYWKEMRRSSLLPNAGVFMDTAAPNRSYGYDVEATGGTVVLATLGLDWYIGPVSVGLTYQRPVAEHLGGGQINAKDRWMTTVNYIF
jgi:hypothetical protein